MATIRNLFDFLEPKNFIELPEKDISEKCKNLSKIYSKIVSDQFSNQYIQVIPLAKFDLTPSLSFRQLSDLILNRYGCLESEFSEVYVALMLFFTLPVTVASVERSFSKLKIIKNFKRILSHKLDYTILHYYLLSIKKLQKWKLKNFLMILLMKKQEENNFNFFYTIM